MYPRRYDLRRAIPELRKLIRRSITVLFFDDKAADIYYLQFFINFKDFLRIDLLICRSRIEINIYYSGNEQEVIYGKCFKSN